MDAYIRHIYLEKTESFIVRGEMAITRQLAVIDRLRHVNASTDRAERVLGSMEAVLRSFYANRDEFLERKDVLR